MQNIENIITADTILFFDMDGTLIDTNLANFLSYEKAIISVTKLDCKITYSIEKRFNRSNLRNAIPNLTETEYEKIIQLKEEFYNEFIHKTKLNKTIVDILVKYSKTNKTVLVTNCRKDRAVATLKHFNLYDKFSNLFYREFGDNNRINKFKNAVLKLGVPTHLIVVFENEDIEVEDARIIGIKKIIKI